MRALNGQSERGFSPPTSWRRRVSDAFLLYRLRAGPIMIPVPLPPLRGRLAQWPNSTTNVGSRRSTTSTAPPPRRWRHRGPGAGVAADAADAARPAEPRPARRRHHHLQPAPRQAPRHLQADRHGHRGVPPQPPGQVREHHAASTPAGPPSATSATPPAAPPTAATPSRSSGSTAASGSGSRFAFNGQLANFAELRDELLAAGRLPPDARHRHRSHHALPRLRAARRRAARPGRGVPQPEPEVRRRVQHRLPERAWATWSSLRDPHGLPAAVLRPGRPAVRRRQRERRRCQPRLPRHPARSSRAR